MSDFFHNNQEDGDAKTRIKDVALQLFSERGFSNVGVRDIMNACGLTGGALYAHFESKEELLANLVYDLHFRLGAQLAAHYDHPATNPERFARLVYCKILFSLHYQYSARVANSELRYLEAEKHERLHALRRKMNGYFDDTLASGAQQGDFDLIAPVATRMAVFSLLNSALQWFDPRGALTAGEVARSHTETALRMVMATGALGIGIRAITTQALAAMDDVQQSPGEAAAAR